MNTVEKARQQDKDRHNTRRVNDLLDCMVPADMFIMLSDFAFFRRTVTRSTVRDWLARNLPERLGLQESPTEQVREHSS